MKHFIYHFKNDECLPNLVIFGENELLEVHDNLDDDEISLFVGENRNLYATELRRQNLPQSFNVKDLRCLLK